MRNASKLKLVLNRAWALARYGRAIFGGPVKSYLAEAMRQAWADVKSDPVQRACDEILAEQRSGKIKPVRAIPYHVRRYGDRAITQFLTECRA